MKPYVYKASAQDAIELAPNLRDEDVAEIQAASGSSPLVALLYGVEHSNPCYAMADEDGVFGLFGAVPDEDPQVGRVWMLGSGKIVTHAKTFLRESKHWIREMHKRYPVLQNYIDSRNNVHIRFITWLGCLIDGEAIFGDVLFFRFSHI